MARGLSFNRRRSIWRPSSSWLFAVLCVLSANAAIVRAKALRSRVDHMDTKRAKRVFIYGLRLRCPNCGLGSLYKSPFGMRARCEYCDITFEREQGYFIGAIYVNIIVTESLLLLLLVIYSLVTGAINERIIVILIVMAIVLPLVFYHHSRSLWLSFDHIMDPEKRVVSKLDQHGL